MGSKASYVGATIDGAMAATVHRLDLDVELPDELACDALILPTERAPDGTGIYHESVVTFAKELRAFDVSADYQDDAASRKWYGERAVPVVVLELFVALGAHAAWDAIKSIIKRVPSDNKVRLRIARRATTNEKWELLEAEGGGEEVADALEAALSARGRGRSGGWRVSDSANVVQSAGPLVGRTAVCLSERQGRRWRGVTPGTQPTFTSSIAERPKVVSGRTSNGASRRPSA